MANKKPARKGGKKIAAPKKAAKAAPKKGRASNEPTPIEDTNPPMPAISDADTIRRAGETWAEYRAMAEKETAEVMAALAASVLSSIDLTASAPRLTVEEQWQADLRVHGTDPRAEIPPPRLPGKKPGLLRRALYRFRSAVSGLFVSKQYAEANPDTTVRERAD